MIQKIVLPTAMFAVATAFYFYEFLLRVAPGAIFSDLMLEFQIDATSLGLLSSFYFISYAALQLPVGVWMDQVGPRRLLTLAIVICSISTMGFAQTHSYTLACVARLFIGAGSAFAFISCMKIVTLWFPSRQFGMLAGWTLTIGTLGAVFGESPLAYALQWIEWRPLMFWIGAAGLILAVLAWVLVRDENNARRQMSVAETVPPVSPMTCLKVVCRSPQNWLIALYAMMTTGPTDALGGMWGIPFLVHVHGVEEAAAATAVSMTFVGLACGSPFLGWASDRWHSRRKPMALAALGSTLSLIMVIYWPTHTAFTAGLCFFSFGFSGVYVLSFVTARDQNPPQYVGTMVGFVNMAAMLGSSIMMYAVGVMLDWVQGAPESALIPYGTHAYHVSLSIFPIAYATCVILIVPLIKESFPEDE